jgi:hypothetical protein
MSVSVSPFPARRHSPAAGGCLALAGLLFDVCSSQVIGGRGMSRTWAWLRLTGDSGNVNPHGGILR